MAAVVVQMFACSTDLTDGRGGHASCTLQPAHACMPASYHGAPPHHPMHLHEAQMPDGLATVDAVSTPSGAAAGA